MPGKITLITPPDFFENGNKSIFLININEEEQDNISKWLAAQDFKYDLNIYLFSNEPNVAWFLYALNRCEHKYINIDCVNLITQSLSGYALSRSGVYYKTSNTTLAEIYNYINGNRVNRVEDFLESALNVKTIES